MQALVFFNGWMCDEVESQQQLLERFEGSLVGPSIRPVPFTNPDGSEGTDLFLDPEAFREAFAADLDAEAAAVMAAAQRPTSCAPVRVRAACVLVSWAWVAVGGSSARPHW